MPAKKGRPRKTVASPTPAKAANGRGMRSTPNKFTAEKKAEFLRLYAEGGSVRSIAKELGISSVTVFIHARTDEDFRAKYKLAMETNTDACEDHMLRMAIESGVPGNVAALFGILKARRPEKWRDNVAVQHSGSMEFVGAFAEAMKRATGNSQASRSGSEVH